MEKQQMNIKLAAFFLLGISAIIMGCSDATGGDEEKNKRASTSEIKDFNQYWYQGKAELSKYNLKQSRYGEIHKGHAVLIFVTEDFLTGKQVKWDSGDKANATSVLKLNFVRKFDTGIYPYSIMTSTFTPVDLGQFPHSLKSTTSIQEWCGHVFFQLNLRDNEYKVLQRSYFQSEGDKEFSLDESWLEDELWSRIRIAPSTLPVGDLEIIPGVQYLRLSHNKPEAEKATAKLETAQDPTLSDGEIQVYTIEYKNIDRHLTIKFDKKFPYDILEWEEQYPSLSGKMLTTRAVKTDELFTDYWSKNNVADSTYQHELGL